MKILTLDEMLEAAIETKMPGIMKHITSLESASNILAAALAEHLGGVGHLDATWQGKDLQGMAASFYPLTKKNKCPKCLDSRDPGGDWDVNETK